MKCIEHRLADFPSNSTVLELPITSAHAPNTFVSVALFKPPTDDNSVPSFKVGYVEQEAANDEKWVDISIEMYFPEAWGRTDGGTFTVTP